MIEEVVHSHPAVREVIVIGMPHHKDGQHPVAFVVLKDTTCQNLLIVEQELIQFINGKKKSAICVNILFYGKYLIYFGEFYFEEKNNYDFNNG